jgi:hypothetical protein
MRRQRFTKIFKLFLGPASMLVPALQAILEDESPTRLPGAACLPLQATNELIEFLTG